MGHIPTPSRRDRLIAPLVDQILDDPQRTVACSDLTLLEFHDVLTSVWRDSNSPSCDVAWWELSLSEILDRVEDGRLIVLPTPAGAYAHVMTLVTISTRDHGRALKAWDALHMHIAARWARAENARVEIVTADEQFEVVGILSGLDIFLSILNLDIAAGTGAGADTRP